MASESTIELWGGIECTINRVGDQYFDQINKNGFQGSDTDLEKIAELGIKAIRFPVLWERHCADSSIRPNCSNAKRQLTRLRELGVEPIVGLLHHGSGPSDTSLLDPDFPKKFADYAQAVARQLPDFCLFTPINEPLTTARFSALYGFWYPHKRDDVSFLQALINQVEATRLAMQAIRSVNPNAKLVQTENLEQCHSTSYLRYQAEFENQRRWLSIDLLAGRVDSEHPLWGFLEHKLQDLTTVIGLSNDPVRIDMLGWNYYLTSERYLDHRTELYPSSTHGGNGRDQYADVEAVRVLDNGIQGWEGLLRQAWERYRLPMAITEAHLGCHRESQVRWFMDAWQTAHRLQQSGIDLRAVTAWNLLGSYDWDSLCTKSRGHYEPGAFDTRSGQLRPTLLASLLKQLSESAEYAHPAITAKGWWERPDRIIYSAPDVEETSNLSDLAEPAIVCVSSQPKAIANDLTDIPPLLVTGATGTLGKAFGRICQQRHIPHHILSRSELDITQRSSILDAIQRYRPWAIINTAGYVRVDCAERNSAECFRANTEGARQLASVCEQHGISLVTYSSDLVFDGRRQAAYTERDLTCPLNVYGESKMRAEEAVLDCNPKSLVIRSSSFFGPWDDYNFLTTSLLELERGNEVVAINDWQVSPTYVPDLVQASLDLLLDGAHGIWHLVNDGKTTWHDFLYQAASMLHLDTTKIVGRRRSDLQLVAPRPAYSVLTSQHGRLLPSLVAGIGSFCNEWEAIRCRSLQVV